MYRTLNLRASKRVLSNNSFPWRFFDLYEVINSEVAADAKLYVEN